jgi:hypothetical protein
MATQFNGYGERIDVVAEDAPHASMFPKKLDQDAGPACLAQA